MNFNAETNTSRWLGQLEVEPGWYIVEVSRLPLMITSVSSTYTIYLQRAGTGNRIPARYDVDKGMFLDHLPITIDANVVRNLIRNIDQK